MAISMPGRCALSVCLATVIITCASNASSAGQTNTFVIAAAQGYGVEDCLAEGGECGRVVADAWCAANGQRGAVRFGRSDSRQAGGAGAVERPYFITCGD